MIKIQEYTTEIHIKKLVEILSKDKILCNHCPASIDCSINVSPSILWNNLACLICTEFIDLTGTACPCIQLEDEQALEINPNDTTMYYNIGIAYGRKGNKKKSIEFLKYAAQLGHKEAQDLLRKMRIYW